MGITAIELAEGVPPYSHIHPMRALFAIKANPPQGLTDPTLWSDEFKDFVKKCLSVDPKARPNAKDLLNHYFIVHNAKNKAVLSDLVAVSLDAIEKARSNGVFDQVIKKENSLAENNTFIAYTDTVVRKDDHPDPLWSNSNSEMFYGNHGGTVIEQNPGTFLAKDDEKGKLPDFVMQQITRMNDEPSSSPSPSFLPPSSSSPPLPSSINTPPPFTHIQSPPSNFILPPFSIQPTSVLSPPLPPPPSLLLYTEAELLGLDLDGLYLRKKKLEKEFQIEIANIQDKYGKALAGIDKVIEKKKKREPGAGLTSNQNNLYKNGEISARINESNPKLAENNQKSAEHYEKLIENNSKFTEISSRFQENVYKYAEISGKISENVSKLTDNPPSRLIENNLKYNENLNKINENNSKFPDNPPSFHDRPAKTQQDFHSSNVLGEQTLPRKEGQRGMLKSQNREVGKSPNFGRGEKQEGNKMDFSFKNTEHVAPPRTPEINRKNEPFSRNDKNENFFAKINENILKQEKNDKTEKAESFQNIYKNEIKTDNFSEFPFAFGKMTPNHNNSSKLKSNIDDAKKSMGLLNRHTPNTENPAFQPGKIPFYMGGDPNKEKKLNGGGLATGFYQNYQRNMMMEKNDKEVSKSKSQNKLV